jgi:demethylmenaquinone methyltransferase/2-methoxy-6-polyprenyl-1,4-benzoquinol methylase
MMAKRVIPCLDVHDGKVTRGVQFGIAEKGGLRNVGDPKRALREFRRVLRPGGRLVVLEFDEPQNPVIRSLNRFYTHRVMPFTASLIARDASGAYKYLPRSVETFLDRDRLREAIFECGFATVEQRPLTFGTCVVSCGTVAR